MAQPDSTIPRPHATLSPAHNETGAGMIRACSAALPPHGVTPGSLAAPPGALCRLFPAFLYHFDPKGAASVTRATPRGARAMARGARAIPRGARAVLRGRRGAALWAPGIRSGRRGRRCCPGNGRFVCSVQGHPVLCCFFGPKGRDGRKKSIGIGGLYVE
jgi:hypothetical protein